MTHIEIPGDEVKRRIDRVTMLNATVHKLRAAAKEAYLRGEFPYKPVEDVRTDYEYWKRLAEKSVGACVPPHPPAGHPLEDQSTS